MIDINKALSQRCYIIFDSNQQLRKFVDAHKLKIYIGINKADIILSVHPLSKDYVTIHRAIEAHVKTYNHSKLTITDDGE
jgi:hypothetical protein